MAKRFQKKTDVLPQFLNVGAITDNVYICSPKYPPTPWLCAAISKQLARSHRQLPTSAPP